MASIEKNRSEDGILRGSEPSPETSLASMEASDLELKMLRLFNHYRHDWMNDIQLLYGYIQLKKYDKIGLLMEKIKQKVQQESFVSKLGVPKLIVYFLSYQAEVKELRLDIAMEHEIHLDKLVHSDKVASAVIHMLELFRKEAAESADRDNELKLEWRLGPDNHLEVKACYAGGYDRERLDAGLQELRKSCSGTVHTEYANNNRHEPAAVCRLQWNEAGMEDQVI